MWNCECAILVVLLAVCYDQFWIPQTIELTVSFETIYPETDQEISISGDRSL